MENSNLAHHIPSLIGLSTAFFLSGTHFSASQLTLPILYHLPTATSTAFFSDFYYRGARTVAPLALVACFSFATAAVLAPPGNQRIGYGIAAGAAISPLAWTVTVIASVNSQLLEMSKDARMRDKMGEEKVRDLLKTWKWMNNVRAGLALVGGAVGLSTFVMEVL